MKACIKCFTLFEGRGCKVCKSVNEKKRRRTKPKYYEERKKIDSAKRTPEMNRLANLWYKYKVTLEEYNQMFDKQKGCCAICNTHQSEFKKRLFVDHNHVTGKVRSLLCSKCNMSLGHYENNKDTFSEYLNKYDVVATIQGDSNE